jgi:S-adenosylmethionine decarboxylase
MNPLSGPAPGCEWIVEAHGCQPAALRDIPGLETFFAQIVAALDLHPVGAAVWHRFPVTGGLTGFQMLAESHLACHTFPEYGTLCLNLFCCRPRPDWDFATTLAQAFHSTEVSVRKLVRPVVAAAAPVGAAS